MTVPACNLCVVPYFEGEFSKIERVLYCQIVTRLVFETEFRNKHFQCERGIKCPEMLKDVRRFTLQYV